MSDVKLAAVGDIAFVGLYDRESVIDPFEEVKSIFSQHDIVIGNMESVFTKTNQAIPGKCTLRSNPRWAEKIKEAGINVLSLANNHVMDYGVNGLIDTIDVLQDSGISIVGAGYNTEEASKPLYIDVNNTKVAILARSDVIVSSHCYADENTSGVARFDLRELEQTLKKIKNNANHIVLVLHWGLEHYSYPSQTQRDLARKLLKAGVDVIIGHHSHVLQGIETYSEGIVTYSLGNFVIDDFSWEYLDINGKRKEERIVISDQSRMSGIFSIDFSKNNKDNHTIYPTRIEKNTKIVLENEKVNNNVLRRLNRMFNFPFYSLFWIIYAIKKEFVLRIYPNIRSKAEWKNIKKIRIKHLLELSRLLKKSLGIATEKSTNPYD